MLLAAPHAVRTLAVSLGVCLALAGANAAATTAKPADKDATRPAAKPALVATYGDWSVFQSQAGKSRICYALAQPKDRAPADLKRDPGYAFISERPAESVRNEVSFIMGFDVAVPGDAAEAKDKKAVDAKDKKAADAKDKKAKDKKETKTVDVAPTAAIGEASFDLLPKGANLWVKNAAKESALIAEMRKGGKLQIKAASKKGHVTTDTYSLSGFAQAIDRALKECPSG
jgi:invasion protein IalB